MVKAGGVDIFLSLFVFCFIIKLHKQTQIQLLKKSLTAQLFLNLQNSPTFNSEEWKEEDESALLVYL